MENKEIFKITLKNLRKKLKEKNVDARVLKNQTGLSDYIIKKILFAGDYKIKITHAYIICKTYQISLNEIMELNIIKKSER